MEWFGWLEKIDPKLIPPFLIMGLGIYLLLLRRIKAVEVRMVQVETTTASIAGIHQRLDDLFDLVRDALGLTRIPVRPSLVSQASPGDELRLREIARSTLGDQRDR